MHTPEWVIDTNILVSALISPNGAPACLFAAIEAGKLTPVYSREILDEYEIVIFRPHFRFPLSALHRLLALIIDTGTEVYPTACITGIPDPSDAPFIAAAAACGGVIVTGNLKHFPLSATAPHNVQVLTVHEALALLPI